MLDFAQAIKMSAPQSPCLSCNFFFLFVFLFVIKFFKDLKLENTLPIVQKPSRDVLIVDQGEICFLWTFLPWNICHVKIKIIFKEVSPFWLFFFSNSYLTLIYLNFSKSLLNPFLWCFLKKKCFIMLKAYVWELQFLFENLILCF